MKVSGSFQRISDSDGSVIGYIKRGRIYDSFDTPLFKLRKTGNSSTRYIKDIKSGKLFGTLDRESGCLYDTERNFIGFSSLYIKPFPRKIPMFLFLCTFVSFYALIGILKPDYSEVNDEPLAIICIPQSEGELEWSQNSTLNIFTEGTRTMPDGKVEKYTMNNEIAPEDTGMYGFILNNENSRTIEYRISLAEQNSYNIPIKYKLKAGGEYVLGDEGKWLDTESFSAENLELTRYSSMQFELHWKWDGSDDALDTKIGSEALANYMLTVTLRAGYA